MYKNIFKTRRKSKPRKNKKIFINVPVEALSYLISYGPERGHYATGFDDFGVVEELRRRAFQRHQNYQNPLSTDPVEGHIMI